MILYVLEVVLTLCIFPLTRCEDSCDGSCDGSCDDSCDDSCGDSCADGSRPDDMCEFVLFCNVRFVLSYMYLAILRLLQLYAVLVFRLIQRLQARCWRPLNRL